MTFFNVLSSFFCRTGFDRGNLARKKYTIVSFIFAGFLCQGAHADLVAFWTLDNFGNGIWVDAIEGAFAETSSGTVTADGEGVVFDGQSSLSVAPEVSPVANLDTFSLTARFKLGQGASRRDPNNGNQFWANSPLIGRELPGGARGDYGLAVNSENELVAGWGNPDRGIVDTVALGDGEFHVATATFDVTASTIALYRDGQLVETQDNPGQAPEAFTVNMGVNILDVPNDTAYLTGKISDIMVHNTVLSASEVAELHRTIPEPTSVGLLATGLLAIVAGRRRRR